MKKNNYHNIYFTDEVENIIKEYMKLNGKRWSETVNFFILEGSKNIMDNENIVSITNGLNKIISKLTYSNMLMEQLYSDFNIDEPTDPQKSVGLKIFKNNIRKSYDK